jgi:tetratricopeptide (TPR) repeat protein
VEGWRFSERAAAIEGLHRAEVDTLPVVMMIDEHASSALGFRNAQCVDESATTNALGSAARRRLCADHAWDEIAAIVQRFQSGNQEEINNAIDDLVMAPPPRLCVDGDLSAMSMAEPSLLGAITDRIVRDLRWQIAIAPNARLDRLLALQSWVVALQQPRLTINFRIDLAGVYAATGNIKQAVAELRIAVAVAEASHDDRQRAKANINIVRALFTSGVPGVDDALRNAKDAVGRLDNPAMTAWLDQSEGLIELSRGNTDAAISLLQKSVAFYDSIGMKSCRYNVVALQNLAGAYQLAQRLDEAQVLYDRALQSSTQRYGSGSRQAAQARGARASNLMYRQKLDEAANELQLVADDFERLNGNQGPDQMQALGYLCELRLGQGELALADIACHRALAIGEKAFGLEHPQLTWPVGLVAQLLLAQKNPSGAEVFLRRAQAIFQHGSVLPNEQAHNQALLAIALARQGHRTKEALQLASAAMVVLAKEPTAGDRLTKLRKEFPALKMPR